MNILITGSKVFVGRNLVVQLKRREGISANLKEKGVSHSSFRRIPDRSPGQAPETRDMSVTKQPPVCFCL
jgi:hypothetical protein